MEEVGKGVAESIHEVSTPKRLREMGTHFPRDYIVVMKKGLWAFVDLVCRWVLVP